MIFSYPGHIEMIRNGLKYHLPADNLNRPVELRIVKTQTRRVKRGIYKVGKDYAVQRKRGAKAEPDIRIVMDKIWEEKGIGISGGMPAVGNRTKDDYITKEDALAEGGYTPGHFEELFRDLNPEWDGWSRWAFEFHVIEVTR